MSSNFDRWAAAFTSRRRFVQWIGATAAVGPWAGVMTGRAVAQAPASPPATAPATPTPPPADPADAGLLADAHSLGEIIERRFGSRLTPEQLAAVRDDIRGNLQAGRTLRSLCASNASEPAVTFRARPLED